MIQCLNCGKDITPQKFCSQFCRINARVKSKHVYEKFKEKQCAECGATRLLHVHHKDENPTNNDLANLITLCRTCHGKAHQSVDKEQINKLYEQGTSIRQIAIKSKCSRAYVYKVLGISKSDY